MSSTVTGNSDAAPLDDTVVGTELVKSPSAALAADLRLAQEFRRRTKAESTEAAYRADWVRFQTWATARGVPALPTPPNAVEAYVSWLADEGYGLTTVERFLAAGSHYHRAAGFDFPRNAPGVREALKGIRRAKGTKRSKKAPLGLSALSVACTRVSREAEHRGEPDVGLRNRAMLTVGWFCMLRSANLVAIRREHVRLVRFEADSWIDDVDQPEGLILHLPESKTDQLKEGRDVAVYAQDDETVCPVRALATYFASIRFELDDLIFPISARTVSRLIKRLASNPEHGHVSVRQIEACVSCATAARRFASHSLRRGSATTQAGLGVPEREIMRQGGWKNERVMRGYIDEGTLFQNNPTRNLSTRTK